MDLMHRAIWQCGLQSMLGPSFSTNAIHMLPSHSHLYRQDEGPPDSPFSPVSLPLFPPLQAGRGTPRIPFLSCLPSLIPTCAGPLWGTALP